MKILVISDLWLPFPGGAERMISNITDALAQRGHEIRILTSYAKAKSHLPMAIKDIGVYDRHDRGAKDVLEYIQYISPDLILTHHFFAGEFAKEIFDGEIPVIEIIHNRIRNWRAKLAIFNSRFTANRCGMVTGDMILLPPVTNACVALGCGHSIGHIKPLGGKGIEITYQLARIMPERKFLILRGEWQDGEDIRSIPNVEFMEPVDDIRDFYARCRVVLMPSLSEDAGTVPLECALNGIPCISSDVGGLKETNFGGVTLPVNDLYPWITEICKLDHVDYYTDRVKKQRHFVNSLDFDGRFDELDRRVREICKK